MRLLPFILLVPTLVLSSCGKKDLETEPEPTPAPDTAAPTPAPARKLPAPGLANLLRVPDATSKLPDAKDTQATGAPVIAPPTEDDETATVTVRPPAIASPPSGNTE